MLNIIYNLYFSKLTWRAGFFIRRDTYRTIEALLSTGTIWHYHHEHLLGWWWTDCHKKAHSNFQKSRWVSTKRMQRWMASAPCLTKGWDVTHENSLQLLTLKGKCTLELPLLRISHMVSPCGPALNHPSHPMVAHRRVSNPRHLMRQTRICPVPVVMYFTCQSHIIMKC